MSEDKLDWVIVCGEEYSFEELKGQKLTKIEFFIEKTEYEPYYKIILYTQEENIRYEIEWSDNCGVRSYLERLNITENILGEDILHSSWDWESVPESDKSQEFRDGWVSNKFIIKTKNSYFEALIIEENNFTSRGAIMNFVKRRLDKNK